MEPHLGLRDQDPLDAMAPLIPFARGLARIEARTGRAAPTVIT